MTAFLRIWAFLLLLVLSWPVLRAVGPVPAAPPPSTNAAAVPTVPASPSLFNFTVNSLDGKPVDLSQYKGQVVLVVNTASHGGFTSQYNGLEKIYEDYKGKDFVVLGFPCNDFGGEEPGPSTEIAKICSDSFHVTFPLFEKIRTRGEGQSPVYAFLTTGHGVPQWNFHKYLVGKTGKVIAEFPSQIGPEDKQIRDAIDAALKG